MKDASVYLVSGIVDGHLKQGLLEAMSPRHACYRFCREFDLNEAESVPGLQATNIVDEDDAYSSDNNGLLEVIGGD